MGMPNVNEPEMSRTVSIPAMESCMRLIITSLALFSSMALLIPDRSQAESLKPPLRVPRVQGPVKIDGVLDDAIWVQALKVIADNEIQPGDNVPSSCADRSIYRLRQRVYIRLDSTAMITIRPRFRLISRSATISGAKTGS